VPDPHIRVDRMLGRLSRFDWSLWSAHRSRSMTGL